MFTVDRTGSHTHVIIIGMSRVGLAAYNRTVGEGIRHEGELQGRPGGTLER